MNLHLFFLHLISHQQSCWLHKERVERKKNRAALTSFSYTASAFCRRRISTSTWFRACFSLTSKAPLSVSALASFSLLETNSSPACSHFLRQSSKFTAIWRNSGKQDKRIAVLLLCTLYSSLFLLHNLCISSTRKICISSSVHFYSVWLLVYLLHHFYFPTLQSSMLTPLL